MWVYREESIGVEVLVWICREGVLVFICKRGGISVDL